MKNYFGVGVMTICLAATSCTAVAADASVAMFAPGTSYYSALQVVLVLLCLAVALVAARWMYDWNQCRKATRAATKVVKERVARGEKPYC
ncbi:hypothetical protein NPS53_09645 [Pseudomonas putida]|uniref:hypothetical protein n=1 Tax=Pseudomonas putida TaxID=303 RepID=UPI002363B289|nr:hypothetical protein [Pseudomonas putida]MDD2139841.1 hypothetical protein [Pseudomonas putida]HDS1721764.1 hypothetical protein [Pseudomonas putida]